MAQVGRHSSSLGDDCVCFQARLSTTPSRHFRDYLPAHLRTTQLHPSAPACSLFLSLAISNSCPTDCSLPPSALLFLGAQNPADRLLPSWRKSTYFIHSLSPFPAYLSRGAFPSLSLMDGQTTGLNFSENRPRQTATAVAAAFVFDVVKRRRRRACSLAHRPQP